MGEYPARDAEQFEQDLHKGFGKAASIPERHTRGAEWFTPTEKLLSYIRENAKRPEYFTDFKIPPVIGLPINR